MKLVPPCGRGREKTDLARLESALVRPLTLGTDPDMRVEKA